jgi:hypothetical protein
MRAAIGGVAEQEGVVVRRQRVEGRISGSKHSASNRAPVVLI